MNWKAQQYKISRKTQREKKTWGVGKGTEHKWAVRKCHVTQHMSLETPKEKWESIEKYLKK